jgi:cytochrome P450
MTDRDLAPVVLPTERTPGRPFDPPAELGKLRAERPLARMSYPDRHVGWLVTGYPTARAVLADPRFSAQAELQHTPISIGNGYMPPAAPGQLMAMDPPEHTRYRRLLTRQFTTSRMKLLEVRIERMVAEHLDALAQAGQPVDLVTTFASPISILAIGELLGVPDEDRRLFQENTAFADLACPDTVMAAFGKTASYVHDLVRQKRVSPTDDLLGALTTEGELTDEELVNISMMLFVGGTETTANMISLGVFALLEHPTQLAALRENPKLVTQAVEELLRYLTIAQIGIPNRVALDDVELDGHLIRKGETVTIALPAVNHDPERFTDPERFHIGRTDAGSHLAFGHGIHRCLGQQLARIEMRIAYTALFERFPTLHLAIPAVEVSMRETDFIYGPKSLPVAWG